VNGARVIEEKYRALAGRLDEATLRLWAAVEARTLGRGGVSTVAKAIGMSRTTIYSGLQELASPPALASPPPVAVGVPAKRRIRAEGGGRKRLTDKASTLLNALDALVEPTARGDPQSPLRWTCKSTPRLAQELAEQGHPISQRRVCDLLAQLDYSLQSTRKTREGGNHPSWRARDGRDVGPELLLEVLARHRRVLDGVVEEGGRERDVVEPEIGEDHRDPEWVRDIRIARAAHLVAMRVARVTVDLMRPVPVAPLTIESEVLRGGCKIQLCAIRLLAGGVVVVGAAGSSTSTVVFDAATNAAWAGTETTGASAYDTASVTGAANGPTPTGTVTYTFFNGNCDGTVVGLALINI